MCGLVGVAGNLEYKDEGAMKRLLALDFFRGPDSTGFSAVRDNGEIHLSKLASHPFDLFEMPKFKSALSGYNSKAFIGHNRFATRGGISSYNAHPFQYDHIVGAHNGTLETRSKWDIEDALNEKFDVDSQAVFAAIAKLGIEATVALMHEGKNSQAGAWALVWYDQQQDSLNFLKNTHRPLWYAVTEDFKKLFWASEWPMIDAATRLSGDYKLHVDKEGYKFWPFEDDMHYRFDLELMKKGDLPIPKAKVKELKGKELVAASNHNGPFGNESGNGNRSSAGFHTPKKRGKNSGTTYTPSSTEKSTKVKTLHLMGDADNPFAGMLDELRYDNITRGFCAWCMKDMPYGTAGVTVYDREDIVLCPTCSGHDEGAEAPSRIYLRNSTFEALL